MHKEIGDVFNLIRKKHFTIEQDIKLNPNIKIPIMNIEHVFIDAGVPHENQCSENSAPLGHLHNAYHQKKAELQEYLAKNFGKNLSLVARTVTKERPYYVKGFKNQRIRHEGSYKATHAFSNCFGLEGTYLKVTTTLFVRTASKGLEDTCCKRFKHKKNIYKKLEGTPEEMIFKIPPTDEEMDPRGRDKLQSWLR